MFRTGYSAMSQSPATTSFNRKQEEDSAEALSERMQYMIDIQNASIGSIGGEYEEGEASEEHPAKQLRAIMPTYPEPCLPIDSPDPTVGKGQIIFPSSYQLSAAAPLGESHDHFTHQDFVVSEYSHYPDYMPDNKPSEPCCCFWQPFVSCCSSLWQAENLHRSFCYGAIDGMLTGAGLVATLSGFGFAMAPWIVAVTFCACTADSLCMALGHVWSTHVLSTHAAQDRREERIAFGTNRNESKAKLVDLLLSRGMLKIDAMSIADTLEGYPDIFVGALVGDAVILPSQAPAEPSTSPRGFSEGYGSYGQFSEIHLDPDAAAAQVAVAESRSEGFVMLISFALFGTLPAVVYHVVTTMTLHNVTSASDTSTTSLVGGPSISPTSGAITITCLIMWFLGVWKSKFFDSNYVLFGIETVVVLMVCILTAYAVGSGLSHIVKIPGVAELSSSVAITDDL